MMSDYCLVHTGGILRLLTSFLEKRERPCLVDSKASRSGSSKDIVVLIESSVDDVDGTGGLYGMSNMHDAAAGARRFLESVVEKNNGDGCMQISKMDSSRQ